MTINQLVKSPKLPFSEISRIVFAVLKPDTKMDASAWVLAHGENEICVADQKKINAYVCRRKNGEPLEYVVGSVKFNELTLAVNKNVLIPRPETAELIEMVKQYFHSPSSVLSHPIIAEIGTGSGVIAISLAKWVAENHLPIKIIATDISEKAIAVAKSNSFQDNQIDFRCGDLLEPISKPVIVIVANLPYIPSFWLTKIDPSVKNYEPSLALDGGVEGYDLIDRLVNEAKTKLKPHGKIFLEIWDEHTQEHFEQFANFKTEILLDSFSRVRFAVLEKI